MNKKELMDLPTGTIFYLKYRRNNRIKTYEYIKTRDRIILLDNDNEYGISYFYLPEFDFTIDKDLIFVENSYYTIVEVIKIIKPTKYEEIYKEE